MNKPSRVRMNIPSSGPAVLTLRGSTGIFLLPTGLENKPPTILQKMQSARGEHETPKSEKTVCELRQNRQQQGDYEQNF